MPFEVSTNHIQPLAAPRATRAIVNGGFFVAMATALRQSANDYKVTLSDRCDKPGGLATIFKSEGFHDDAWRTVICVLWLFEEFFALFRRKRSDRITLAPLDHEAEAFARRLAQCDVEAARTLAYKLQQGSGRYRGRLAQARMARL